MKLRVGFFEKINKIDKPLARLRKDSKFETFQLILKKCKDRNKRLL